MADFNSELVLSKTDPSKDKLVLTGDSVSLIFLVTLIDKDDIIKPKINSDKDYVKLIQASNLKKVELDINSAAVTKSMILSMLSLSDIK